MSGALLLKLRDAGKNGAGTLLERRLERGREDGFYAFDGEEGPLRKPNAGEKGQLQPAELAVVTHLPGALGRPDAGEDQGREERRGERGRACYRDADTVASKRAWPAGFGSLNCTSLLLKTVKVCSLAVV